MDNAPNADSVRAMADDSGAPTAPLDDFIASYRHDNNVWWMVGCGHHQNLFDAALDRIEELSHIEQMAAHQGHVLRLAAEVRRLRRQRDKLARALGVDLAALDD